MSAGPTEPSTPDHVAQGASMLVVLHSHCQADIGRVFRLGDASRTLVGRSDSCDCVLQERSVSRMHFSIELDPEDGSFYVLDRCSAYGTYLNRDGRSIEREQLRCGDRIRAGGVVLQYFRGSHTEGKALHALGQLAFVDPLTGALRAEAFQHKLQRRLASEPEGSLFVFCVELRELARINQLHGVIAGDMVLSELAQRIRAAVGDHGQLARVGGCRFLAFKQLSPKLREREREPVPARESLRELEQELRLLPIDVNAHSFYPELVVKPVSVRKHVSSLDDEFPDSGATSGLYSLSERELADCPPAEGKSG